ncbi:MAG TPA: hypothetical protein VED40_04280 [Azospirillaceae bacterium]|nr:hypothetical protein [Azospirillaceae bacterium]
MQKLFAKDKVITVTIWTVMLTAAWSLPVVSYVSKEQERAKVESGAYYKPGMPADWYVRS